MSAVFRTSPVSAVLFMLLASALIAVTMILAKALGIGEGGVAGLHPFQVSAGRFFFALMTLIVFMMLVPSARPRNISEANWKWHVLRSAFGWMGVTCMFAAAARMPLAEATAISFLSPLVTLVFAMMILKESVSLRKWLATGLSVLGAYVILQPGTEAFRPAGLLALVAALFMGLEAIFIKKLSDAEPSTRILFINNMIGAAVSVSVALTVWGWPSQTQWLRLVALGATMISAQACFIQSMKRAQASLVMPVFYTVLVFSGLYDLLIYGISPTGIALLGAGLIVAGAMLLALPSRRRKPSLPPNMLAD